MSTVTEQIAFELRANGQLTDTDDNSVALADPSGAFGLRRLPDGEIILPSHTPLLRTGPGQYALMQALEPATSYEYWVQWARNGETRRLQRIIRTSLPRRAAASLVTDVAQAVADELNVGPFDPPLVAAREYRPTFDMAELKTLRVTVVPRSLSLAGLARSLNQHDVAVDVAVQKKVDAGDTGELDTLMGLVEQIAGFFRLRRLEQYPAAVWAKTENSPIYSPEHLESKGVFMSVLTLTFRVMK